MIAYSCYQTPLCWLNILQTIHTSTRGNVDPLHSPSLHQTQHSSTQTSRLLMTAHFSTANLIHHQALSTMWINHKQCQFKESPFHHPCTHSAYMPSHPIPSHPIPCHTPLLTTTNLYSLLHKIAANSLSLLLSNASIIKHCLNHYSIIPSKYQSTEFIFYSLH
jgi:hypothetical protein